MILYFLRHANAGTRRGDPSQDEKRPLDQDGIDQCAVVGRFLASLDVAPDLIVSSPLKRATETATLVANEIGYDQKIDTAPALRPDAEFESFQELLRTCGRSETLMVVGHNPTISQFLSLLITAGASDDTVNMKKAGVARVDYTPKRCILNWIVTPKIARTLQVTRSSKSRPNTSRK